MARPRFDVGQIIRDWGSEFYAKYPVVPQVRKSFGAMAACRTRALGGHVEVCPECGEIHVSYNSCRDRHCPKCQNKEREVWIEMRKEEIMPGVKNTSTSYSPSPTAFIPSPCPAGRCSTAVCSVPHGLR